MFGGELGGGVLGLVVGGFLGGLGGGVSRVHWDGSLVFCDMLVGWVGGEGRVDLEWRAENVSIWRGVFDRN